MTAPRPAAEQVVRLSTRLLPAGPVRERYRRELVAELHELDAQRQLRYAVGVLSHTWALRRAIAKTARPVKYPGYVAPLHCRLHLLHRYRYTSTDDGQRYRRCRDCGRDDPYARGGPFDPMCIGIGGIH